MTAGAAAETLRLAVYHVDFERSGPGLLYQDIRDGDDPQINAAARVIAEVDPDILLLLGFDYDAELLALSAFADRLAEEGAEYPESFARRPNAGWPTGVDVDGDGRLHEPEDSHGFGRFSGQGGMAILSRYPIDAAGVRDHSEVLWRDRPSGRAADLLTPDVAEVLRLSSMAIWDVPVLTETGPFHLITLHAAPPVFDGPEDRNGWRNHDELMFIADYLRSPDFEAEHFAVLGTFNVDPERGEGRRAGVIALLTHPRLQDPRPSRPGGGDETVDWPESGAGELRVDYILPAIGLDVSGAAVHWPDDNPDLDIASAHRLVWVDVVLP